MNDPRYSLADFEEFIRLRLARAGDDPCDLSDRMLAALCGRSPRQVKRWREGGLPWWLADRLAVTVARTTPHDIWPSFSHDVEPDEAMA